MGTNKETKSGLYNWSLVILKDSIFCKNLSYAIGKCGVSQRISVVAYDNHELLTIGFKDGVEFYNYMDMLDKAGAIFICDDETTIDFMQ